VSDTQIEIKSLYKIFGPKPKEALDAVREGTGKDELLEKHKHVLGLSDINLSIKAHSIHVIMGLSGSGKSTLIRHINRLIEPTAGEMIIDGQDILALGKEELLEFRRHKTAMVFQRFALLPHKTILENVAFGLTIQNVEKESAAERAMKWIERVGLSGFEKHFPKQLSGGMQQRVGLARALSTDTDILLMDEAFSALDPLIRKDMQDMLLQLQDELKKTIVFITHDLDEALRLGENIGILKDGILVQNSRPEKIIMEPADDYVRDFVKDVNRLKVLRAKTIMSENGKYAEGDFSKLQRAGEDEYIEMFVPMLLKGDCDAIAVMDKDNQRKGFITKKELADSLLINSELGNGNGKANGKPAA